MTRTLILMVIAISLNGCASSVAPVQSRILVWDGRGNYPNKPIRNAKSPATRNHTLASASPPRPSDEDARLAALVKYSPEWWSIHDAIESEADAKLAKAMIICRGCLPHNGDDQTASIK